VSWQDWLGLGPLALLALAPAAVFFNGVWVDVVQPRLFQWRERRRIGRLIAAQRKVGT
jgi:hypothetical protein